MTSPDTSTRELDDAALDQLFLKARTHSSWTGERLSEETLRRLWSVARWAPTSFNCNPARVVFVMSDEGKERLLRYLSPNNRAKTRSAPCCAIVAIDTQFYEELPKLVPQIDLSGVFRENPEIATETAFRNASLQGAYLIMAARALGLDASPMSGFDNDGVDKEFFPDGRWKSNFLLNLGYGSGENLRPRGPRLDFDDACRFA